MSEPYDNRFDGYLGWNDDEEYAQFERDYEDWLLSHLKDDLEAADADLVAGRTVSAADFFASTAHLDAMDRLGRKS